MLKRTALLAVAAVTLTTGCGGTFVYLRAGEQLNNRVPVRVRIYRIKLGQDLLRADDTDRKKR
jgi:outer membrane lipopolysaccharide assembly protein LptE/RlpB